MIADSSRDGGRSRGWARIIKCPIARPAAALLAASWLLLLAPAAAAQAAQGGERTATDVVRETSDAVLDLIDQAQGYARENPDRFYREVESVLAPVVDFESFARSVMAAHYRDATPEQRQRFTETFKWGLVRTYALALLDFQDGKVVVVPPDRPPRNPQRQTVKMEIHTQAGEIYPVLYSVTQEDDGDWQIRNLIVNGVNMGLTYRNQFNSAMNDPKYGGDMDRVIEAWGGLLKAEAPLIDEEGQPGGGSRPEPEARREPQGPPQQPEPET